ncbi:MAG: MBL fold metallo-hydrolase [Clostridiales bacterium]|nr:MBL fold metallo-hydrolase [Clostridiales bacterium]MCI6434767.1 MBL fold metallo-hydrolase [Clostridiales bacterium]
MEITVLTLGGYMTNCYILRQEASSKCLIIDPGYEAGRILSVLQQKQLEPEAILLTHGHFDHVGAVQDLAAETDCDVYIAEADLSLPPMITNGKLYYTHTYPASGTLNLAGLAIRVLPTPGHTPGSVCLLVEDTMFSGDTLFQGSCGRTDLPGGSWEQIAASLKTLAALPGDYRVLPGHGGETTLDRERQSNPYL